MRGDASEWAAQATQPSACVQSLPSHPTSHQGLKLLTEGFVELVLLQILVLKALHCESQLSHSGGGGATQVNGRPTQLLPNPQPPQT